MSIVAVVLLVAALVLLAATELPRLAKHRGTHTSLPRPRTRRRSNHLKVVKGEDSDEFARSVERDLANLPTYDPRAKRD